MTFEPLRVAAWTGGRWDPRPPAGPIGGVSQDTRRLFEGDLYVALRGPRFDGHEFVPAARRLGAAAALVAIDYVAPAGCECPLLRVADPLRALADWAAAYRATWSGRIIGVTGSVGKTTVRELIACLLNPTAGADNVARSIGNWNNAVGVPLSILKASARADFGVFEIGTNHPGEIEPLALMLKPEVGVITMVGPAHLEFFHNTRAIALEKAALLRVLPPDGLAVLNADHEHYRMLREAAPGRVVSVSMQPGAAADYCTCELEMSPEGIMRLMFKDSLGGQRRLVAPLSGRHQAANLLLAAATARELGCEWERMQAGLQGFRMPEMRWQTLKRGGATFVNDAYNANPVSMRAAIETFAAQTAGRSRRWLVLGGMLELGADAASEHRAIGRLLAREKWRGVVAVGEQASGIAAGARETGFPETDLWECADAAAAAAILRRRLRPGDMILLKGSRGFKLESILTALPDNGDDR